MAWRSWLYWSNIACDRASVAAVGDGEGVAGLQRVEVEQLVTVGSVIPRGHPVGRKLLTSAAKGGLRSVAVAD